MPTTSPPSGGPSPRSSSSSRPWQVAFGVAVVLLAGALLYLLLGDGDDDVSTSDTTSTSSVSSTSVDPAGTPSGPECSADALLAASGEVYGAGVMPEVTEFDCTPTSLGDVVGGFAWARLTPPPDALLDPSVVFYSASVGEAPEGAPLFGEWQVLGSGSDVACEDFMDAAACDQLAGVPRR